MKRIFVTAMMLLALTGCAAQSAVIEETAETSVMASVEKTVASEEAFEKTEFYEPGLYTQKGTGKKKPEDFELPTEYYIAYIKTEEKFPYITSINDKAVQRRINEWIDGAYKRTEEKKAELEKLAESDKTIGYTDDVIVRCDVINGYLGVEVQIGYGISDENVGYAEGLMYYFESAFFDLYTGERLEFSDLFYEDVDFISYYNRLVEEKTSLPMQFDAFGTFIMPRKREFGGITEDGTTFSLYRIAFNKENPYFTEGFGIYLWRIIISSCIYSNLNEHNQGLFSKSNSYFFSDEYEGNIINTAMEEWRKDNCK